MKTITTSILAISLVSLAALARADEPTQRTFEFKADTQVQYEDNNGAITGQGGPWKAPTLVNVLPYLFVAGNFGGTFTVKGWGSGTSAVQTSDIEIRHNETLNIQFSGFDGSLPKVKNSGTGEDVPIDVKYTVSLKDLGGKDLDSKFNRSGEFHSGGLDGTIGNVATSNTSGRFLMQIGRQIRVSPQSGPGTYKHEKDPTITISRV